MKPKTTPRIFCPVCGKDPISNFVAYDTRRKAFLYKIECHGTVGTALFSKEADDDGDPIRAQCIFDGPDASAWQRPS